jgi:phosphoribosylaminoimidazole carboxylase PurE protein
MMKKNPLVAIIMGSDSDLPTMQEAAEVLDQFKVAYELTIVSAHRTPERMVRFAQTAQKKGFKVIIAGAGGAAHLPGMTASLTTLPVIGVPIKTSTLSGLDSLYSIVQMPRGVPVATVAIDNAQNAGLLAIAILSTSDKVLQKELKDYKEKIKSAIIKKAQKLEKIGNEAR